MNVLYFALYWAKTITPMTSKLAKTLTAVVALSLLAPLFVLTPAVKAQTPAIVISEFLASNQFGLVDNTGSAEDWIELHNTSGAPVDLAGWTISDGGIPHTFASEIIDPDQHLVVFASGEVARSLPGEPHVGFKLAASGESLQLRSPSGILSLPGWVAPDEYPAQTTDVSYGLGDDGNLYFFSPPTPGADNGGGQTGIAAAVTFSVPAGYYSATQSVVLNSATPNATIRYTTDGSEPSAAHGTAVSAGTAITVSETTVLRAVAVRDGFLSSSIETRSYLFTSDIVNQPSASPAPGFPNGPVNGQVFDYEVDPSVNSGAVATSLVSIPSISVVTDTDNLFDPSIGIYVNASERGREWERPASIELIDPTGAEPGFDINGGIRIRGGFSRRDANPKHSFRLFFRDEYESDLFYPLFGSEGVDEFGRVDLRTAQNYAWSRDANVAPEATFIDELWSRDTQAAIGQPYTRTRPYHLYLNGVYWGLFMTQERVSGDYAETYFGGDNDDYDVVKRAAPERTVEASDGTLDAWQSLYPLVSDGRVTDAEFATLDSQVDLENLADYYLLHFYSGDDDGSPSWFFRNANNERYGASNNWFALRNRFGVGEAGKWIFFDHDSEHSLCASQGSGRRVDVDNTTPWPLQEGVEYMSPAWLHQSLITHPSYRQIFADSVQEHMLTPGGALTVAEGQARYDARAAEFSAAIDAESARWGDGPASNNTRRGSSDWNAAVAAERQCIADRFPVVEQQLREDGLWPSGPPAVISPASGALAFATAITIGSGGQAGTIWYTVDGSDPLGANGNPTAEAIEYNGPFSMVDNVTITARVLRNGTWSPVSTVTYVLSGPVGRPRLIVNEYNAVSDGGILGSGGSDATFGVVQGNGGDWFEVMILQDNLDARGMRFDVWHQPGTEPVRNASLVLGNDPLLNGLRSGTIITVSESIPDDPSYNPVTGDWHINLQANAAGDGAYFAAQSDFEIDHDSTQIAIWDSQGRPEALRTGEGVVDGVGVSSAEVFKLEAAPTRNTAPTDPDYNDGTSSTFGLPNTFSAGGATQDLSGLRIRFGDTDCDGTPTLGDASAIVGFSVGLRTDTGSCPIGNSATELYLDAGDINLDGTTNLIDALIIARCSVGLPEAICPE